MYIYIDYTYTYIYIYMHPRPRGVVSFVPHLRYDELAAAAGKAKNAWEPCEEMFQIYTLTEIWSRWPKLGSAFWCGKAPSPSKSPSLSLYESRWRSLTYGRISLICLLQSNPDAPWWVNACCRAGQEHFDFSCSTEPPKTGTGPPDFTDGPRCRRHLMLHCITALLEKGRWVSGWSQLDGEMVFWRFQILSISDADLWWSRVETAIVCGLRHTMQLLHSNKRLQLLSNKRLHSSKQWQWRSNKQLRSKWHRWQ